MAVGPVPAVRNDQVDVLDEKSGIDPKNRLVLHSTYVLKGIDGPLVLGSLRGRFGGRPTAIAGVESGGLIRRF